MNKKTLIIVGLVAVAAFLYLKSKGASKPKQDGGDIPNDEPQPSSIPIPTPFPNRTPNPVPVVQPPKVVLEAEEVINMPYAALNKLVHNRIYTLTLNEDFYSDFNGKPNVLIFRRGSSLTGTYVSLKQNATTSKGYLIVRRKLSPSYLSANYSIPISYFNVG